MQKRLIAILQFMLLVGVVVSRAQEPPKHPILLFTNNLQTDTEDNFAKVSQSRGTYIANQGWSTTQRLSQLIISLKNPLAYEGTLEVKVKNLDPVNQVTDDWTLISMWSRPEARYDVIDPTLGSYVYMSTQVSYMDKTTNQGAWKFISAKSYGQENRKKSTRVANQVWDPKKEYTIKFSWTRQNVWLYIDNAKIAVHEFKPQIEPFRYILLGKDNIYHAMPGPIFTSVKIYGPEISFPFTDITNSSNTNGYLSPDNHGFGHGASFADVNLDGKLDLFTSNAVRGLVVPDKLYINLGGEKFQNEAELRGVADLGVTHGILAADFDNDGDLDVVHANMPLDEGNPMGRNAIYRNDGKGYFLDITDWAGLSTENNGSRGMLAIDIENDGDLDLFVVNWGQPNEFYLNDGTGKMTRIYRGAEGTFEDLSVLGRQGAVAGDIDNDGDVDIYVCRRQEATVNAPNWLFINDGKGNFTEEAAKRGVAFGGRSNGATLVDVDNDGDLDLFVVNSKGNSSELPLMGVFFNRGDGTFEDRTTAFNIRVNGFNVIFGDIDNDADLDMYLIRNDVGELGARPKIYLNDGRGNFTITQYTEAEIPGQDARGAGFGDIDGDGDLDIYVACKYGQNYMIRNDVQNNNYFLDVLCVGPKGDYGGYGTKVSVYKPGFLGDKANLLGYQEAQGGYGYLCQNQTAVHFGLAQNSTCDLRVKFTSGKVIEYRNVRANQTFLVRERVPTATILERITPAAISGPAGQFASDSIKVRILDDQNAAVSNHTVLFEEQGDGFINGPTLKSLTMTSDEKGIAAVAWAMPRQSGAVTTLSVAAFHQEEALQNSPLFFTATVRAGIDTLIAKLSGDGQIAPPQFSLPDSIAVIVKDAYENPQADVAVIFSVQTGGGRIDGSSSKKVKTNAKGVAQVRWTLGDLSGMNAQTLSAKLAYGSQAAVQFSATAVLNPPDHLNYVSGSNQTGTVGQPLPQPFVVKLTDKQGKASSGYPVIFKVIQDGATFNNLRETSIVTNSVGEAAVTLTLGNSAGEWLYHAIAYTPSLHDTIQFQASAFAGPAVSMQMVDGNHQFARAMQTVPLPLRIQLFDSYNNPVANHPVTFTCLNNLGWVNNVKSITINSDPSGYVQVSLKLGEQPGTYEVQATSSRQGQSLQNSPVTFKATATSAPSKLVRLSPEKSLGAINQIVPTPLQVKVVDAAGNPIPHYPVKFLSLRGGGHFNGALETDKVTNEEGMASAIPILGSRVGDDLYLFRAQCFGDAGQNLIGSPIDFTVSARKSFATELKLISGDQQRGQAGEYLAQPLVVKVVDGAGNAVAGHDIWFEVIAGSGKLGNGASSVTMLQSDPNGFAQIQYRLGMEISENVHVVQVRADDGLNNLGNSPLMIHAHAIYGPPDAKLSKINASPAVVANGVSEAIVLVQLRDAQNNPVQGEMVTVSATGSYHEIIQSNKPSDANGEIIARIVSTRAELKYISARIAMRNLSLQQTATVRFTSGPVTQLEKFQGDEQTGIIHSVLQTPLVVRALDAFLNPVIQVPIVFKAISGQGHVRITGTILTDSSGLAMNDWVLGAVLGPQQAQATTDGLAEILVFHATAEVPSNPQIVKVSGDDQYASPGAVFADSLVVRVQDEQGNPIYGMSVSFNIAQGDAILSAIAVQSDKYGKARVQLLAGSLPGAVRIEAGLDASHIIEFNCAVASSIPDQMLHVYGDGLTHTVAQEFYPLAVRILDKNTNPIANVPVYFTSQTEGAKVISEQPVRTTNSGQASARIQLGPVAKHYTFTASSGNLKGSPLTFRMKANASNPHQILVYGGQNQDGKPLETLDAPIAIKVVDVYGNSVAKTPISFNVTAGGGKIKSAASTTTDSSGLAMASWELGPSGSQSVQVTSPALPAKTITFNANLIPNLPPIIACISDTMIFEAEQLIFVVNVTDPEGKPVIVSVQNLPTGAEFDPVNTRLFIWTPTLQQQGSYTITFLAQDANGGTSTKQVVIHVRQFNRSPFILEYAPTRVPVELQYYLPTSFSVRAVDPDDDPLSYSWTVAGKSVKGSNLLNIVPNLMFPTAFDVQVTITDKVDTISQQWSVVLKPTFVELKSFTARSLQEKVIVQWEIAQASNCAGFNVLRAPRQDGPYQIISNALIPFHEKKDFYLIDYPDFKHRVYFYKLEEIDKSGNRHSFDPVRVELALPESNALDQNYPNPFNPETTLKFQLAWSQKVTLHIYNVLGELVRALVDERKEAGYHRVVWNGRNDSDQQVTSGIYYGILVGERFRQTIKIILLK